MKNTSAKTITTITTATGIVKVKAKKEKVVKRKRTSLTLVDILTKVVIKAAKASHVYVPYGLHVDILKKGVLVSNASTLLMNKVAQGEMKLYQAKSHEKAIRKILDSEQVLEMISDCIALIEANQMVREMPLIKTKQEREKVTEDLKVLVKGSSAAIQLLNKGKSERLAENKMKVRYNRATQKATRVTIKKMKADKKANSGFKAFKKSLGIKGMDKTGFLGQSRRRALYKDRSVTINTLKANPLGRFDIGVTTMNENEAIRMGFIKGEKMNARVGRSSISFDNFSKQIVLIDLSQGKEMATSKTEVFVWWNGRNTVFAEKFDDEYFDLTTGAALKPRAKEPRRFEVIGGSPSSLRKNQTLLFDVTNGYDQVDALLDAVTDGGYGKIKGRTSEREKMSKYVTRFFSWTAPNKVIGEIKHTAIYFNNWNHNKLDGMAFVASDFYAECLSHTLGVNLKREDVEGVSVQCRPYSAKTNAVVVNMAKMFSLLANEAKETVYLEEVTPEDRKELDKAFNKQPSRFSGKMVVFGKKGCTPEFVSDLNGYKIEFNWGAPSNFRVLDITKLEKSVSIIGGANTSIQMLESILAADAEKALDLIQTLRAEQIEQLFKSLYIDRSIQVPSMVDLSKNVYVQSAAKAIAPNFVLDKDFAMYKKVHEELFKRINKIDNSFKYAVDGCYNRILADVACLATKHGILQYGEAYIADGMQYFQTPENFDRFKDESAAVKACYGKKVISMFKYPKMGTKEFYKASLVDLETIKARVERLIQLDEITVKQAESIIDFYETLKPGSIVVPSIDLLKQQCAGLDFDWDGATIVFDPRFNALLPDNINITNIITKKAKKENGVKKSTGKIDFNQFKDALNVETTIKISAATLKEAFLSYMTTNNNGWSVGSITNANATQIAVLILAKTTKKRKYFSLMRDMLISWFNHEGGEGQYENLPKHDVDLATMDDLFADFPVEKDSIGIQAIVTDVSTEAVQDMIHSIEQADWNNPKNLIAIFEDLIEVFRYYQELTIDSAKTGDSVTISIAPGRKYMASMLHKNTIDFNWGRGIDDSIEKAGVTEEAVVSINIADGSETTTKKVIHDMLFDLRAQLSQEAMTLSDQILEAKNVKTALEDVVHLAKYFNNEKYLGAAGQTHKSIVGAMNTIKSVYGDLTANYISAIRVYENDDEAMAIEKQIYRDGLQALRSMGRKLTSNMTMTQRGALAKFVASHRISTVKVGNLEKNVAILDPTGGSSFASSVFAEEYLMYITKHFAEIDFCGEKLVYNEFYQDGDVISLVRGIGEYAATTADITGDFVVKEVNGQFYATRQIAEVIEEQLPSEDVLVRVSDADEKTMAKVAAALNSAGKVNLIAQSVRGTDGKFEHTYGIFNEAGEKLAGLDVQGELAKTVNGITGKIKNLICDVAVYGEVRKPYILALVSPVK